MARKKVVSLSADTTVDCSKPGTKFEGYYIGAKTVTATFGPCKLHHFVNDKGTFGAWGAAQLDQDLASIPKGAYTYVKYVKKVKAAKGTKKVYEVDFDDELTMDLGGLDLSAAATKSEEPSYSEGSDDSTDEEGIDETLAEEADLEAEAEEIEAAPAPRQIKPAQTPPSKAVLTDAQRRVQDVLNRNKSKSA